MVKSKAEFYEMHREVKTGEHLAAVCYCMSPRRTILRR
jgi:NADH:ubiquinone oxidoreductase subunit E